MANIVCPDNSTTCLLRALLNDNTSKLILEQLIETNNAYDWNPVTLGFTVAIGVLAFIVAVVTVFQGCLAAGPGRLKAGHQAIGPWYKHSDVSFNWYQLAARSTAYAPFIDVGKLEPEFSSHVPNEQKESVTLRKRLLFGCDMSKLVNDSAPYNASWANLLGQACVTETKAFGPPKPCHTDYIEDSLRAAPASGKMKSLVFLATYVNDTSSIESPKVGEGRLYKVRGLSSELVSRNLETMGPAAAFVCFGRSDSLTLCRKPYEDLLPRKNDLIASFKLFNGKLPFGKTELNVRRFAHHDLLTTTRRRLRGSVFQLRTSDGFFKTNDCPILLALCIGEIILRPRAFPKKSLGLIEAIAALTNSSIWGLAFPKRFWKSFVALSKRATKNLSEQQDIWKFPARLREAPFLELNLLWDKEEATSAVRKREDYLAKKLKNVKNQMSRGYLGCGAEIRPTKPIRAMLNGMTMKAQRMRFLSARREQEAQASRTTTLPLQWEGKVEIASIVYALTRSITRVQKYSPEQVRHSSRDKSILEEIRRDRLATDRNRVLLQNEIVCIDEWLRQQEKSDSNVVMCALMVLMKVVDTHDGLSPEAHRKYNFNEPNSLSDGQRREAMKSAFVYIGYESKNRNPNAGSSMDDERDDDDDDDDDNHVDDDLVSNKGSDPDPCPANTKVDQADKTFWDIVEVLRYRALLYAAVLELCADSSAFRENYTDFSVKII